MPTAQPKVLLTLEHELLKAVDEARGDMPRSEWVRLAMKAMLAEMEEVNGHGDRPVEGAVRDAGADGGGPGPGAVAPRRALALGPARGIGTEQSVVGVIVGDPTDLFDASKVYPEAPAPEGAETVGHRAQGSPGTTEARHPTPDGVLHHLHRVAETVGTFHVNGVRHETVRCACGHQWTR